MRYDINEMPNTVRLLKLYRVFEDEYVDTEYSLSFVRREDADVRTCCLCHGNKIYRIFFDQKDIKHIHSNEPCEEAAKIFLQHLTTVFYEKASDDPEVFKPGYVLFNVNGLRWKVKTEMQGLVHILPFSCGSSPYAAAIIDPVP